jgi:hypothetical protein
MATGVGVLASQDTSKDRAAAARYRKLSQTFLVVVRRRDHLHGGSLRTQLN